MTGQAVLFVGALVLIDQFSKILVIINLKLNQSYPVLKDILHLTRVHNTGAAFGFFKERAAVFIFLSLVTILLITLYAHRFRFHYRHLRFGLLLILAGTIGNLIDRLRFGYVVDFIDLRIWPVFNFADVTITLGGAYLLYHIVAKVKNAPNII